MFAIHSGLPLFVVSRTESKPAAEIRDWFRARIIGQDAAIDAVVEMIAFYKEYDQIPRTIPAAEMMTNQFIPGPGLKA